MSVPQYLHSSCLFLCLVSVFEFTYANQQYSYETKWITQQLDHFSWANTDTFEQKYLVNTEHWCGKDCPILFYLGHDGPDGHIETFANENTGWIFENAEKLQAMIVFAEHRFYGSSTPYQLDTSKMSHALGRSLGYLTVEQTLADYAMLIYELKTKLYNAKNSPVIGISGGYGGFLSAWFRMKYPNSVIGSIASAAAIFQFPDQVHCKELSKVLTDVYMKESEICAKSIGKSWHAIIEILQTREDGFQQISNIFNTCDPLKGEDLRTFFERLGTVWYFIVMNDYPHESNYYQKMPAYPLKKICSVLDQDPDQLDTAEHLKKINEAITIYANFSGQFTCLNLNDFFYPKVLFDFQLCTEMIVPHCGLGLPHDIMVEDVFKLEDYLDRCRKNWGVEPQVGKVQALYHDTDLSPYSNIIFSSGTRDPYYASSPTTSIKENGIHAIVIPEGTFMEDLRASGPNDTEYMKKARREELEIVAGWIEKYYLDHNLSFFMPDYKNQVRDEL